MVLLKVLFICFFKVLLNSLLLLVWDVRRNIQTPVCELKQIDEFVSSMITDSSSRLLLCTSGEGTLTAYNTRARKMDSQVTLIVTRENDVLRPLVVRGLPIRNELLSDDQARH